ncbi:DMT family transporter [Aestuariispira insulae]|uniref:EamA domain-containing membrane protein RarD n=1 Tax=Aestuariispira insulae TaxID=1461337 RepID=A0A3D9HPM8_9PROT|nr:DMT family transporter [Aestuariispira insulae]RED51447.1 EamA domain-containing membrane protein RarD [Aestuariispira insulae]
MARTGSQAAATPAGWTDYALLVTLAAIWGGSFLFIKIAIDTIPPMTIAAGRIALAAGILYLAARIAGQRLPAFGQAWIFITGIAIFGNAVPFTLIGWGEEEIDSGLAAILMAIVPLCTLVVAHFFTSDEKITTQKVIGLIIGFTGIILLIGPSSLLSLGTEAIHQLAVALGAACYGFSSVMAKQLSGLPRRGVAAAIMITSTSLIVPMALITDQPWLLTPSGSAVFSVVMLGVTSTALAQIILLKIVKEQGASFLSLNNYMVPVFGLIWGMIFLAERPDPSSLAAFLLIMAGIAVTQFKRRR